MKANLWIVFIVNIVYVFIWYGIHKLRSSKTFDIAVWDNGYTFYSTLSEKDKQQYWKADSRIVQMFFLVFLVFMEASLFLLCAYPNDLYWMMSLGIGIIISGGLAIVLSFRLQRKFKEK